MWVFTMKHASCLPSDAQNFEVASRFFENVCTTGFRDSTAYVVQGKTINQFKIDSLLCNQKRDYKTYKKVIIKIIFIRVSQ
jgi:hypothetical protein